jgi:hypothetical protein
MTSDAKVYFGVISPAADTAVALARLLRSKLGDRYYNEVGGLGFGFTFFADDTAAIVVDWQGKRVLQVTQPGQDDLPRAVQPFEEGGPWIAELTQTLVEARQLFAEPAPGAAANWPTSCSAL